MSGFVVSPSGIVFEDTLIGGGFSDWSTVQCVNTNFYGDIVISGITCDSDFLLSGTPSFPVTLHPTDRLQFLVRFQPTTAGTKSVAHGVTVTTTEAGGTDYYVALSGVAWVTFSFLPLAGHDKDMMLSFAIGSSNTVAVKKADPYDLNCEEIQIAEKATDLGERGLSKSLARIYMLYEDLGAATVYLQALTRLQNAYQALSIGSSLADTAPVRASSQNVIDGEILDIIIYKNANSGPLSLVDLIFKYEPDTTALGASGWARNVTSVTGLTPAVPDLLLGFITGTTVAVKKADSSSLDCEEAQSFERLYNMQMPGVEKSLYQLFMQYENLGVVAFTVAASSRTQTQSASVGAGTSGADSSIQTAIASGIVNDEYIKLKVSKAAASGPLSVTQMNLKFEDFVILLGTTPWLRSLTPAAAINALTHVPMLAFCSGSTVSVKRADPSDLNCEEDCSITKTGNLPFMDMKTYENQLSGFEKSLMRVEFKYENLGEVSFTVQARTKRQTQSQAQAVGTVAADSDVLPAVADLTVTDEIIEVKLTREAGDGPLSLVDQTYQYEPRGEVVKNI